MISQNIKKLDIRLKLSQVTINRIRTLRTLRLHITAIFSYFIILISPYTFSADESTNTEDVCLNSAFYCSIHELFSGLAKQSQDKITLCEIDFERHETLPAINLCEPDNFETVDDIESDNNEDESIHSGYLTFIPTNEMAILTESTGNEISEHNSTYIVTTYQDQYDYSRLIYPTITFISLYSSASCTGSMDVSGTDLSRQFFSIMFLISYDKTSQEIGALSKTKAMDSDMTDISIGLVIFIPAIYIAYSQDLSFDETVFSPATAMTHFSFKVFANRLRSAMMNNMERHVPDAIPENYKAVFAGTISAGLFTSVMVVNVAFKSYEGMSFSEKHIYIDSMPDFFLSTGVTLFKGSIQRGIFLLLETIEPSGALSEYATFIFFLLVSQNLENKIKDFDSPYQEKHAGGVYLLSSIARQSRKATAYGIAGVYEKAISYRIENKLVASGLIILSITTTACLYRYLSPKSKSEMVGFMLRLAPEILNLMFYMHRAVLYDS